MRKTIILVYISQNDNFTNLIGIKKTGSIPEPATIPESINDSR